MRVRRDRANHLGRRVAAFELGHDRARVALGLVVHVGEALVVGVVQQAGHAPQLRVLALTLRKGDHCRFDGEAMAAQGL